MNNNQQPTTDEMVNRHMGLVVSLAKRYARSTSIPLEDLIQEGCIGLLNAIKRFDPARGVAFSTYATPWIAKYVRLAIRKECRRIHTSSIFDPIEDDLLIADTIPSGDDTQEEVETRDRDDELDARLDILSPLERQIIISRFGLCGGDEHTQREVAKLLKLSVVTIRKIEQEALHRLRATYEKRERGESVVAQADLWAA